MKVMFTGPATDEDKREVTLKMQRWEYESLLSLCRVVQNLGADDINIACDISSKEPKDIPLDLLVKDLVNVSDELRKEIFKTFDTKEPAYLNEALMQCVLSDDKNVTVVRKIRDLFAGGEAWKE